MKSHNLDNFINKKLISSYEERFSEIFNYQKLSLDNIQSSLNLFENESLRKRNPMPKKLEVICIVGGLPFENEFINSIVKKQIQIKNLLGNTMHYMVRPENLAVEAIVLKWPNDKYKKDLIKVGLNYFEKSQLTTFKLISFGFQFHLDGAIIMRCLDIPNTLRKFREEMRKNIPNIPLHQSSWCHIPLGRILEPLSQNKFSKLITLSRETQNEDNYAADVSKLHFVHEKRWYQLEKDIVKSINLY